MRTFRFQLFFFCSCYRCKMQRLAEIQFDEQGRRNSKEIEIVCFSSSQTSPSAIIPLPLTFTQELQSCALPAIIIRTQRKKKRVEDPTKTGRKFSHDGFPAVFSWISLPFLPSFFFQQLAELSTLSLTTMLESFCSSECCVQSVKKEEN